MTVLESFHHLVALLWPQRCLVCERALARQEVCSGCLPPVPNSLGGPRCHTCWSSLPEPNDRCGACKLFPPLFRYERYLWRYSGAIASIIRIIKYRPSKRLTVALAEHVAPRIATLFPRNDWDLIIPTPATLPSLRSRGFNQCAVLARYVGAELRIPIALTALVHHGSRIPQASLSLEKRARNVRHAFSASSHRIVGKRCLLIDDVATTGATSTAATQALLRGGAATVDLFTLARSDAWGEYRYEIHRSFA